MLMKNALVYCKEVRKEDKMMKRRYMSKWIWGAALLLLQIGIQAQITEVRPGMEHEQIIQLLQSAGPGDTLLFREGTYYGNYQLKSLNGEVLPGTNMKHNAFRLEDHTFSRPEPFPATVWADDLFMAVPFLLRMAEITGDISLYDEVARQVIQFNHYLADPSSGLYFHG